MAIHSIQWFLTNQDTNICDNNLGEALRYWTSYVATFFGSVILIVTVFPYFIIVILALMLVFYIIKKASVYTDKFILTSNSKGNF